MSQSKKTQAHSGSLVAKYYWRAVRAYPINLFGALISIPITVLANNYLPSLILATVLSRLSQHQFEANSLWDSFGSELFAYAGLFLFALLLWRAVDYFVWQLEIHIQQDIAHHIFRHLLSRSADFHANNFSGSLVSQSTKFMSGYVRIADTTFYQAYPMVSGIVIAAVILLPRAPLYVAALVAFSIIYIAVSIRISRPVTILMSDLSKSESKQTGLLADAITNVMAIKSFAATKHEKERFRISTEKTRRKTVKFAIMQQKQMITLGFMNRTISAFALFIAIVAVMRFHANIATVFLIFSYTSGIVDQLFQFSNNSLRNYNRAFGDAADMALSLQEEPEIKDPETPDISNIQHGDIVFNNVTFTHTGANDSIFDKLNVHIKHGEKIGLIGHSGSGKSTLTRILLRFSDIDSGEVLLDGQNTANITQDDLHRAIAYVPQEPLLFHRSIRENIAYGQLDASPSDIETVAKMASAHEFIQALPEGYETLVGERGVKLSGGQRQRIAIARAMIKNAPVLVLDEATSALDSESEVLIQSALWKLMEGRTAIVIAHRLSTIQKMDRIIVLSNGKIVEEGSHKELLAKADGTYAKLWAHQSGGFIED